MEYLDNQDSSFKFTWILVLLVQFSQSLMNQGTGTLTDARHPSNHSPSFKKFKHARTTFSISNFFYIIYFISFPILPSLPSYLIAVTVLIAPYNTTLPSLPAYSCCNCTNYSLQHYTSLTTCV